LREKYQAQWEFFLWKKSRSNSPTGENTPAWLERRERQMDQAEGDMPVPVESGATSSQRPTGGRQVLLTQQAAIDGGIGLTICPRPESAEQAWSVSCGYA